MSILPANVLLSAFGITGAVNHETSRSATDTPNAKEVAHAGKSNRRRAGIHLEIRNQPVTTLLRKGSLVQWNRGTAAGEGTIVERFERRVTQTVMGRRIARHGTAENPAFLIEQSDGAKVLKRRSELQSA